MTNWSNVISQIEERHPPLRNLRIAWKDEPHFDPLPNVLKTIVAASVQMLEGDSSGTGSQRMAMVLPRLFYSTVWIAVGTVLCAMRDDLSLILRNPLGFKVGGKLLIDNKYIVEFAEETSDQYKIRLGGPNNLFEFWPKSRRLRMQPTSTKKSLSKLSKLPPFPPDYPIDRILEVTTSGRRDIFKNNVVLVTSVGAAEDFAGNLMAGSRVRPDESEHVRNLFQWGHIGRDARVDITSTGQIKAEPVLLLAPDALALRDYLRDRSRQLENRRMPLVIFDGSSTFRNKLDVLDNILDTGCPVMICLERHEEEGCAGWLSQRSFNTWRWSQTDLLALQETDAETPHHNGSPNPSAFKPLQRAIANYARQHVMKKDCAGDAIDLTAEALTELLNRFDPDQPDTKELEGCLYRCLLGSARLLYPAGADESTAQELQTQLSEARREIENQRMWLSEDVIKSALQILAYLEDDLNGHAAQTESYSIGKANALGEIIQHSLSSSFTVVVGDRNEVERTRDYWMPRIDADNKHIEFCYPPEVGKKSTPTEHLVICGWLGAHRMRYLLDGCFAPDMTMLLYSFEKRWFRQAVNRWRGNSIAMNAEQKANALGLAPTDFRDDLPVEDLNPILPDLMTNRKQDPSDVFDITAFELRLRAHHRAALISSDSAGDEVTDACLVDFSDDYYAFITPRHRLRVVTAWLTDREAGRKEIPERLISEIETGDYLVFPTGSSDDVIRDLADLALRKAGKGNLRNVSDLWKDALNAFVESHHTSPGLRDASAEKRAISNLQRAGIDKTEQTIHNWLGADSRTIGPKDDRDLEIIARATRSRELTDRLAEVRDAIHTVRGAHIQASDYLVDQLVAALPEHLRNSSIDESLEIEIEGIGKAVVVRVEDISSEMAQVASSQVNKLKAEE